MFMKIIVLFKFMKIIVLLKIICCFIFLFGVSFAQISSDCPQKDFSKFSHLVGTWKVEWKNRIAPPSEYETTTATSKIEKNEVGCVLTENFSGFVKGKPFNVLILLNFESSESMERIWLDSEHGQFLILKGVSDKELTRFQWEKDMGERKLILKNEYRDLQKDSFTSETFLSTDSGKTWNMVQHAKYSREGVGKTIK